MAESSQERPPYPEAVCSECGDRYSTGPSNNWGHGCWKPWVVWEPNSNNMLGAFDTRREAEKLAAYLDGQRRPGDRLALVWRQDREGHIAEKVERGK